MNYYNELQPILTALEATDPMTAAGLSVKLLGLNSAGAFFCNTPRWWDDIAWHPEIES